MDVPDSQSEVLLKDGVPFLLHTYGNESELEDIFAEHVQKIFGPSAVLFSKRKIKSKAGIGSIPDAFVLDVDRAVWFVVEVELASHPLFDHVVGQIAKFRRAISNPPTLTRLKQAFYQEIQDDPDKMVLFQRKGITEVYKFVADTLEKRPELIIIIDCASEEASEVVQASPFKALIVELKTYYREGTVAQDHIHRFIPVYGVKRPEGKKDGSGDQQGRGSRPDNAEEVSLSANHTHKSILAFTFEGTRYPVRSWANLLPRVCEAIYAKHGDDFERVLELKGHKRPYFSRDPEDLYDAREVANTGIYAECWLSANDAARRVRKVLKLFDYSEGDMVIEEQ